VKVRVRLIGAFIPRFGFSEKELDLPSPCTAADLAARLGMEGVERVMSKHGRGVAPADLLEEGDRVVISQIFSGG
jgi:sulfur carrier protein ThiS